jgi:hypothetical protein
MSAKTTYSEQLDRLFEIYFQELRDMTDKEVLEGEDPKRIKERARTRLERAAAEANQRRLEAGRRRLAAARAEYADSHKADRRGPLPDVPVTQARAYIAKIASSREGLYTLAARKLDDMSDEDLLRLYQQITELEEKNAKEP